MDATANDVLMTSRIWESRSAMLRAIKQGGVKINGIFVDSPDEIVDIDWLRAVWCMPHGTEMFRDKMCCVRWGKHAALVQLTEQGPVSII